MPSYQQTIQIPVQPRQVFDFVADVRNLPSYLPTTRDAQAQGDERVRVQGEAHGHAYDADGYLRRDPQQMRLEWGADEGHYAGWLQIDAQGDQSTVTVNIEFRESSEHPQARLPSEHDVRDGLVSALESIRRQLLGEGGKVEPAAASRDASTRA
jgi:ribosome-associated toxin RatA of RatAB toxin-antitoxin module